MLLLRCVVLFLFAVYSLSHAFFLFSSCLSLLWSPAARRGTETWPSSGNRSVLFVLFCFVSLSFVFCLVCSFLALFQEQAAIEAFLASGGLPRIVNVSLHGMTGRAE
jgi:hypothetical protein